MNKTCRLHWLILFLLIFHYIGHAQSTKGTDFWFGYPACLGEDTAYYNQYPYALIQKYVYIASTNSTSTSATITIPGTGYTNTVTIPANSSISVHLPFFIQPPIFTEGLYDLAVHIASTNAVSVWAQLAASANDDETIVYPTAILKNKYMILNWNEKGSGSANLDQGDDFLIVASQDNTVIQITTTIATQGGHAAGSTYTINLNQGEEYAVTKATPTADTSFTGTVIEGNAPFAVFSGNYETNVGSCTSADNLYAEEIPLASLGTNYILVAHKSKPYAVVNSRKAYYRILATEDNTCVSFDGTITTLNKGEYFLDSSIAADYVSATKPIMIAQFAESNSCTNGAGTGDPFETVMYPLKHLGTNIRFYMNTQYKLKKDFWVNVIVRTAYVSNTLLDGSSIASSFATVPSNPVFSYAQIKIDSLEHTLVNPNGFLAYAYAWNNAISYGYFLGYDKVLSDTVSPTTGCIGDTINFGALAFNATTNYTWHFGDGNTSTSQSTAHTYSSAGTYTVVLNKLNTAGCPTAENDTFTVTITNCTLPIDLAKFDAMRSGDNVLVKWENLSEKNNSYFIIQRSTDAAPQKFQFLAKVMSKGESTNAQNYQVIDDNPYKGVNFYRLKTVDNNGVATFSQTVAVNFYSDISELDIIPNPAKNGFKIIFTDSKIARYSLIIRNTLGQALYKRNIISTKGNNVIKLTPNFTAGVYEISLIGENENITKKLFIYR